MHVLDENVGCTHVRCTHIPPCSRSIGKVDMIYYHPISPWVSITYVCMSMTLYLYGIRLGEAAVQVALRVKWLTSTHDPPFITYLYPSSSNPIVIRIKGDTHSWHGMSEYHQISVFASTASFMPINLEVGVSQCLCLPLPQRLEGRMKCFSTRLISNYLGRTEARREGVDVDEVLIVHVDEVLIVSRQGHILIK